MKKKGFTLIELLAVIIILAVIALIATPIVLDVVNSAKEKARENSVYGYAEAVKLAIYAHQFNNDGETPGVNKEWAEINVTTKGEKVVCGNVAFNPSYGVLLKDCQVGEYKDDLYCYDGSRVIKNCTTELDDKLAGAVTGETVLYYDNYYINYGGLYNDSFGKGIATSDGGYIVIGSTKSPTVGGLTTHSQNIINDDAMIVKFDSSGQVIWQKVFGGTASDAFYTVHEVEENGKTYYVVFGTTYSIDYDAQRNDSSDIEANGLIVKYDEKGNIITKKLFSNDHVQIKSSKKTDNGYIAIGLYRNNGAELGEIYNATKDENAYIKTSQYAGVIFELDNEFNVLWSNFFGGSSYYDQFTDVIVTDSGYTAVGSAASIDYDMQDIAIGNLTNVHDAIIVTYDKQGNLLNKQVFGTSGTDTYVSIVKVSDGYVAVGNVTINDLSLSGSSKVGAILAKYDENLNLIKYEIVNNYANNIINDVILDSENIVAIASIYNSDRYIDAVILKFDKNLNILDSYKFDGGNSDIFASIDILNDGYIISGATFSNGDNITDVVDQYSKGASDGIIVKFDKDLNLVKDFNKKIDLTLIPKEFVKNYGTSIPSYENLETLELYTTNDATKDLKNWHRLDTPLYGAKDNYKYAINLRPFNDNDIISMIQVDATGSVKMEKGLNDYLININTNIVNVNDSWFRLYFQYRVNISEFKLIFNGNKCTLRECVNLGYIEPLVIHGNNRFLGYEDSVVHDTNTVLDGNLNISSVYSSYVYLYFKTKAQGFEGISLNYNTSTDSNTVGRNFTLDAYRNFDISLSKAE